MDRAVDLRGGLDGRHHAQRHSEDTQDLLIPGQGLKVHEQRARRVGDVRDVHAAVHPARQVPEDPGIGVAEHQVAGFRLGPGAVDVVQDPLDLRSGEIGRQGQSHLLLEPLRAAVLGQLIHDVLGPGVLPDNRVVDGLTGGLVPDDGRFALVGNSDGGDVVPGQVRLGERGRDHLAGVVPDLGRVVLHPARLWEDLLMLHLARGHDSAAVVEDDGAGAGGSLVNGDDVLVHGDVLVSDCVGEMETSRQWRA